MIDQIGIALTGVTAIFLTQSKHEWLRKYACLFGIAGQPFWIYSAWTAGQWGILALTALYTLAWAKGVWTHWLKPIPPICPNCDSAMPIGCGGVFLDDGDACRLNRASQRR